MTWKLRVVLILIAAIAAAVAGYLVFRPRLSDRDKIIGTLLDAARAVEAKDTKRALECVSDEYHDGAGLNKRTLMVLGWETRSIEGRISILMSTPQVTINGRTASARSNLAIRVFDSSGTHELFQGPVDFMLRKESRGRWRVIDSEGWQQAVDVEQGF